MIRQREIVIARVLDAPRTTGLARSLERIQAKLAAGGTRLAIGVSTALEGVGIHPNTAHYRLARIAEKTGLDLRNVLHLMELLVAIELADETPMSGLPR